MSKFPCYPIFIFIIYNIIHKYKAVWGYNLPIKFNLWKRIEKLIIKHIYDQLLIIVTKIKKKYMYNSSYFGIKKVYIDNNCLYFTFLYTIFLILVLI